MSRVSTFILFIVLSVLSCSRFDENLNKALCLAGDNREELESVLRHYSRFESDSLKYKAACYLIKNMPYHLSYPQDAHSEYCMSLDSLHRLGVSADEYVVMARQISDRFSKVLKPVYDIQQITSDYLIREINRSFDLWEQKTYLQHLTFDEFCEYVLPYKCLEGQPMDNWRDRYYCYGEDLSHIGQIDEYRYNARRWVEAANRDFVEGPCRMSILPSDMMRIQPVFDLSVFTQQPYGTCKELAQLVLLNSREKGLPVAIDFIPNWPDRSGSHYWNSILTDVHARHDFEGFIGSGNLRFMDNRYGKVFRATYAPHQILLKAYEAEGHIPPSLQLFSKDVTSEYERVDDIRIQLSAATKWRFAYLAVFDNQDWVPVDVAEVHGRKVEFKDVPTGVLYMVGTYGSGVFEPVSEPFVLDSQGNVSYYSVEEERHNIRLYRKFPSWGHIHLNNWWIRGGLIEASDNSDFSQAVTVATFPEKQYLANEVEVKDTVARRYWRLMASSCVASFFAELYFYERFSGKRLDGELIYPEAYIRDAVYDTPQYLVDNDPLTYFAVEDYNEDKTNIARWAGYDFGKPVSIEAVGYMRRGDGNDICPGDVYELYYWHDGKWNLHQRKMAEHVYIDFTDVPSGALYYIKDISRGKQNRTFVYKNGEVFWY